MDGTLIDSAEYHWHTWRDTLAGEGHALTDEQFASWFGQRNDAILRRYFGEGITPAAPSPADATFISSSRRNRLSRWFAGSSGKYSCVASRRLPAAWTLTW